MADNTTLNAGSGGDVVAADEATYSGDTAKVQLVKPVLVTGTEGAKTIVELTGDGANGLDVDVTRVSGTVTVSATNLDIRDLSSLTDSVAVADGGGSLTVDGTVAVTTLKPDGTNTMPSLDTAARRGFVQLTDGTNNIGVSTAFADAESNTQTVLLTEAYNAVFNGTTWDRARGDTTNGQWVNVKATVQTLVDNAGFTDGTSVVTPVGFVYDDVAGTALTENDTAAARIDSKRAQVLVIEDATTRGQKATVNASGQLSVKADDVGASTMNASSSDGATALTSTAQAVKGSAGVLKGYYIYNPNTSAAFVQFYNTAQVSVTVGTTNPLFMLTVPASSAANLWMADGIAFSTAISWSATSTAGGSGAPSTALDAVCWYR